MELLAILADYIGGTSRKISHYIVFKARLSLTSFPSFAKQYTCKPAKSSLPPRRPSPNKAKAGPSLAPDRAGGQGRAGSFSRGFKATGGQPTPAPSPMRPSRLLNIASKTCQRGSHSLGRRIPTGYCSSGLLWDACRGVAGSRLNPLAACSCAAARWASQQIGKKIVPWPTQSCAASGSQLMGLGMAASCLLSDGIWYLEFRNLGIKRLG